MVRSNTIPGIDKSKLKGKHIEFFDRQGKQRVGLVVKITGRTLTIKNTLGERKRLHPDKFRILGVYYRKKLVDIIW